MTLVSGWCNGHPQAKNKKQHELCRSETCPCECGHKNRTEDVD